MNNNNNSLFTPALETSHLTVKDGVCIAYRRINPQADAKTTTPLVLVQGITATAYDWGDVPSALAFSGKRERQVLVFDNRGMGQSSAPDRPYTMDEFASDVIALADHLGYERFDLFGISMGGMISQHVALKYPQRVRRLVLGCTAPAAFVGDKSMITPEGVQLFAEMAQGGANGKKRTKREIAGMMMAINLTSEFIKSFPERYERIIDNSLVSRRSARGLRGQFAAASGHDLLDEVQNIKCPTLVIHGDGDRLLSIEGGEILAKKIPGAKMVRLPKIGHMFWMFEDGLEVTRREVLKFLEADDEAGAGRKAERSAVRKSKL